MTDDEGWKIIARQEIFWQPEIDDPRNGKLVTYLCVSSSDISWDVTILGHLSNKDLAAGLRLLADKLAGDFTPRKPIKFFPEK